MKQMTAMGDKYCRYCNPYNVSGSHSLIDTGLMHRLHIGIINRQIVYARGGRKIASVDIEYCPKCGKELNTGKNTCKPNLHLAQNFLTRVMETLYAFQDETLENQLAQITVSARLLGRIIGDTERVWTAVGGDNTKIRPPVYFKAKLPEGDERDCGFRLY